MILFIFAQANYNVPQVQNIMNWPTAFVVSLPTILGIVTIIIGYLNNKNIKTVSDKQDVNSDKQDVIVHRQEVLANRVNGLKDELVKSSKEEGRSAGVLEGVHTEQERVASNLAKADAASERLEEIRGGQSKLPSIE
jgi:hypothetical protein